MSLGRFGGGPGLPAPAEYTGPTPDRWGYPRDGESVPDWYARELKVANVKYVGTQLEGKGKASLAAGLAYEKYVWDKDLAEGRAKFEAEQAARRAEEERQRQNRLAAARQLKAEHDRREEESRLLEWADAQRTKVPGRL